MPASDCYKDECAWKAADAEVEGLVTKLGS